MLRAAWPAAHVHDAFTEEAVIMAQFDPQTQALVGTGGSLPVHTDDEITRKLSMLIEGECEGLGPLAPPARVSSASSVSGDSSWPTGCPSWPATWRFMVC
jgi:hypothetical protein